MFSLNILKEKNMLKIVDVLVRDIRFPTSAALDGSDA
ncbi:uncharacterized protein METZ01_LOCUS81903, partial [marine metagenome]